MAGFWKTVASVVTGGGDGIIGKSVDIISKKVRNTDKADSLIGEVVLKCLDNPPTIPIVDAIHKIMRQLMAIALAIVYYIEWKNGTPIPLEDFMLIAGGPALYTIMKGVGRS